jgi:hypothetical protein
MGKWASGLAEPRKTEAGGSASGDLCPPQALDQATAFLSFYQSSLASVDERRAAVNATLRELREQHTRVSRTLGSLTTGNVEEVHEVTVLLSSEGLGEVRTRHRTHWCRHKLMLCRVSCRVRCRVSCVVCGVCRENVERWTCRWLMW